jgi:2-oxoglutarate ferredoxin oxidoreductase subunit beta
MSKNNPANPLDKYIRKDRLPHIFCSGCGIGILLNNFARALADLNLNTDRLLVVSGIGCTGRLSSYIRSDGFHTTHGRAIPFATGAKAANPDLKVTVLSGEGDLFAIGGNHFIHAARRNVDLLVICNNNYNYGMTGGQFGATTPLGSRTKTSPQGHIEQPFNLVHLAAAAGAVYVARWTSLQTRELISSIKKGLQKKGFCFIEYVSPCPTYFGRYNKLGTSVEMMKRLQKASVLMKKTDPSKAIIEWKLDDEVKIPVGEFVEIERSVF